MCNQVKKKAESSTDEVVIIRCCAPEYCAVQERVFQCSRSLKGEALRLSILALMKQTFSSEQNSRAEECTLVAVPTLQGPMPFIHLCVHESVYKYILLKILNLLLKILNIWLRDMHMLPSWLAVDFRC